MFLDAVKAFFIGAATLAIKKFTLAAGLQASLTVILMTHFARFRAAVAESLRTTLTAVRTIATQIRLTTKTRFAILFDHRAATVVASNAVPIGDADVSTFRVIRTQNLPNDEKEVEEPTLTQRSFEWNASFALTECVILNVRMGRSRTAGSGVRVRCLHTKGRDIAELVTLQHNRKRP